jgi:ribosome-binding factor A
MVNNKLGYVNQSYKKALGQILLKEFENIVNLTVTDVLIDPSYTHGKVWLRTTPELLAEVEKRRGEIQASIKKYVQTRRTPRLSFFLDHGEIDKVDELFGHIQHSDEN